MVNKPIDAEFVITDCKVRRYSNRTRWLAARSKGIGGSDAPAVVGVSRFKSALSLWTEKTSGIGSDGGAIHPELAKLGHAVEPIVRKLYADESTRRVINPGKYAICWSNQHPWLFATLDGLVNAPDREGPGVLQIKNVTEFARDRWAEEPPLDVQVQVQHEMLAAGCRWASIAFLVGGRRFAYVDYERDEDFCCRLVEAERGFWEAVEANEMPPVDGSESTARALVKLYPIDDGSTAILSEEADAWDAELATVQAELKRLEGEERRLKNLLIEAIGESTFGQTPAGVRYSYKRVEVKEHIRRASSSRRLKRCKHDNDEE